MEDIKVRLTLLQGVARSDVPGGVEPSAWSHQGLRSNSYDSGPGGVTTLGSFSSCQVSGRNIFLWALIGNEERMQSQPFVFYLFMTYSSIEVFRYTQQRFVRKKITLSSVKVPLLHPQHL